MAAKEEEVLVEEHNSIRVLILNRPRVLNSLNLSLVSQLAELFEKWEKDDAVSLIIIKATGGVFCAGGDLRMFYNAGKTDESWKEVVYKKYWLDYHLYSYKKKRVRLLHIYLFECYFQIVLWHGLIVGGGAGFTFPCEYRVVTEKAVFTTPEVAVGFHVDCSASYYLPRLQDHLGEYLALTGSRLNYADMLFCGLATHFIPSQHVADFEGKVLDSPSNINQLLDQFSKTINISEDSILKKMDVINKCFSRDRVEDILDALVEEKNRCSDKWCEKTIQLLQRSSPTALKQTLASIRRGRQETLKECLQREFRLTLNCLRGSISDDLYEGIRAVVIDKDNKPKWKPLYLSEVTKEMVELALESSKEGEELRLPVEGMERWAGKFVASYNIKDEEEETIPGDSQKQV